MYDILAKCYDRFQDVDYEAFVDYYEAVFRRIGLTPHLVLDLGCGTGNVTIPMANRGYEMIGLDASEEMLGLAREKALHAGKDILFLHQDMTEFELYGTVDAMVCALDGVNYLLDDGDVVSMLKLLHYYLNPGGILIFDVNTPYKFQEVLDGNTFVYDDEDAFCVWENSLEEDICYFDLTFFMKNVDGSYSRQEEYQQERVYTKEQLLSMIEEAGLTCLGVYDGLSFEEPRQDSQRLFFVVQR
ncbi:MAG: class I SAM-dependent methyltransferase [Clostridia bacterium]|nr:class I SAM-dependent methyltransferase [Clostridia bacterium]